MSQYFQIHMIKSIVKNSPINKFNKILHKQEYFETNIFTSQTFDSSFSPPTFCPNYKSNLFITSYVTRLFICLFCVQNDSKFSLHCNLRVPMLEKIRFICYLFSKILILCEILDYESDYNLKKFNKFFYLKPKYQYIKLEEKGVV